jgi:hypothetical protein
MLRVDGQNPNRSIISGEVSFHRGPQYRQDALSILLRMSPEQQRDMAGLIAALSREVRIDRGQQFGPN